MTHPLPRAISVNDKEIHLLDQTPIGRQVLDAGGLRPADEHVLLQRRPDGSLDEIGPDDPVVLNADGPSRFFAWKADRLWYFILDGRRFPWGPAITGERLRDLGGVPPERDVVLERTDRPDEVVAPGATVSLDGAAVERFRSEARSWELDVQGEVTRWTTPNVAVRDALARAGIENPENFIIVLVRRGHPPAQLAPDAIIDLSTPGVERLRVTPNRVNNGEAPHRRREFALLPKDEQYLERRGLIWEALNEGGRRWLVLRGHLLPEGYTARAADVAIEIPAAYPAAEIDMFYCFPPLALASGAPIAQTEVRQPIEGRSYQRWSRHREPGAWSFARDGVATHHGLVETCLSREVGA